jgi:hypothetical protein
MAEVQHQVDVGTIDQRMVPLDRRQRRRLLVRASGWIGLGGMLVSLSCLYGPLALNWLLPATSGLLVALVVGTAVALADVAEVWILLCGLELLQEALFGNALLATETLDIAQSLLPTRRALCGGQIGRLRVATPDLLSVVHPGERHRITYSPRARMLWTCSVLDQAEVSMPIIEHTAIVSLAQQERNT